MHWNRAVGAGEQGRKPDETAVFLKLQNEDAAPKTHPNPCCWLSSKSGVASQSSNKMRYLTGTAVCCALAHSCLLQSCDQSRNTLSP